ncbi:Hypothetical predicted protein, partial [Drosophila guanche]
KCANGQSLSALFFAVIVNGVTDLKEAENSRSWSIHPVFRCRRCDADTDGGMSSSPDCCCMYVDQIGLFEDCDAYLKRTALPPGVMVTCDRGVYKLIDGQVELKTYLITEKMYTRNACFITSEGLKAALEFPGVHRLYSESRSRYILQVT